MSNKKQKFKWTACFATIAITLSTCIIVACVNEDSAKKEHSIVAGLGRDAGGVYGHANHLQPLTRIFETLVSYGYHSEIVPQLASDWKVSADGLSWTFTLHPDIQFHDGTLLDAEAVCNALVMHDKKRPGHLGSIAAINALDPLHLQIIHREPFAPLLYELGWFLFSIAGPSAFDEQGNIIHPVGSGPFKAEEWIPEQSLILSRNENYCRNENYWGGCPVLERVTLKTIPDPATRVMALQAGEIDMIIDSGGVLPDDVALLANDSQIRVLQYPQALCNYLVLNCNIAPFNQVNVRKALAHAIDRHAIVQNLLGVGKVASSLIASDVADWHYPAFKLNYDPDRAKALLAQAGWRDTDHDGFIEKAGKGFAVDLLLSSQQIAMGPDRRIAEYIQEALRHIGIRSNIQVLEKGAYYARTSQRDMPHILLWGYPFLGPHNVLYRSFHSTGDWNARGNFFSNQNMDALLEQAQRTMDKSKRIALYKSVQTMIASQVPIIPLYEAVLINAVRSLVKGYRLHPWFVVNWEDIFKDFPSAAISRTKGQG